MTYEKLGLAVLTAIATFAVVLGVGVVFFKVLDYVADNYGIGPATAFFVAGVLACGALLVVLFG